MKIIKLLKSPSVRQGAVVLVDQGLMSLVTFLTGVLIARASSKEEYALYMLGWSLLQSVKGIHDALVNLPFTVYASRLNGIRFKLYQGSTLIHTVLFCLFFSVLFLLVDYYNTRQISENHFELIEMAPILVFLLSALVFRDFIRNVLLAQLKIWTSVGINGLVSFLMIISVGYFYFLHLLTPINTYLIFAAAYSLSATAMFWQQRLNYKMSLRFIGRHFLKNWKLGKWALIGNFAFMGSRSSYPWLILYFLDYQSVAAYSACLALAMAPAPILRGASAYILPRMSHSYKGDSTASLIRMLRKSILVLCFPYILWLGLGVVYDEQLIKLFYLDKFNGYGSLFILMLVMAAIDFIFAPLTNALQVLEKTRAITTSLVIGAIITFISCPFFIQEFGLVGAGIASVISMIATISWRILAFVITVSQKKRMLSNQ